MAGSRKVMDMNILKRVYEAFAQGKDRPPSKAFTAPGKLFAESLNARMHSRISEAERPLVESCWGGQYRGIQAARKDQIAQARMELQAIRTVLETTSLSTEASLLIQVLLDPAEAYLYYRINEYERARELVERGASHNHRLTDEFGYGIISAQRMQLCHNILRINLRQDRRKDTVVLAGAFLDYLEFGDAHLPEEIAWAWIARDAVPESIVQYYFDQVCGEAALASAGTKDPALFQPLAQHAPPRRACRSRFGPHAHAWIACKAAMLKSDWEACLVQACGLLEMGRTAELSLWFATIIDVVFVCQSLGAEGVRVASQIAGEAASIPDAPWLLRPAVTH